MNLAPYPSPYVWMSLVSSMSKRNTLTTSWPSSRITTKSRMTVMERSILVWNWNGTMITVRPTSPFSTKCIIPSNFSITTIPGIRNVNHIRMSRQYTVQRPSTLPTPMILLSSAQRTRNLYSKSRALFYTMPDIFTQPF